MKRTPQKFLALCILAALPVAAARAGTVAGIVRNGTTGSPAAGVDVILIRLQGGMQPVADTKSDAQGRYKFDNPELGQGAMLLRAVYQGVTFHQPAPPGQANVDIEIFEPTVDAKSLALTTRMIAFQPHENTLLIGEEYTLENNTQPPKAVYRADGSFEFELPAGASLTQVSAWGPSGMQVVQGTIDKGNNHYAIAFAFRPGTNGVRLSYEMPYPGNQAAMRLPSLYTAGRAILLVPPGVQVAADDFAPAGAEQGWNVYTRGSLRAGVPVNIALSGTAPMAREEQGSSAREGAATTVTVMPARLDNLKWILIAGFSSLFALGVLFLLRKPTAAVVPAEPDGRARSAARANPANNDSNLRQTVEEVKETLFRLELRRQAGTLSEEEYGVQRVRAEKALRELVKG